MATIHPTAEVSPAAEIGAGTRVWSHVQIRERARIGRNCIIARNVYVECDVTVGDNVKIQNNASLYVGLTVEDGVFIGPHVIFTNDRIPRAINPNGTLKSADDWHVGQTQVRYGAALGAGTVVVIACPSPSAPVGITLPRTVPSWRKDAWRVANLSS